jgi:predicted permease
MSNDTTTRAEFRRALLADTSRDLRYAVRALCRAPGFTAVTLLTLALSIGATTAVFSVLNAVLLQPLPYHQPDALVSIWNRSHADEEPGEVPLSATQFFTFRDENRVFAALGLWSRGTATVTGLAEPEEVQTLRVTYGTLQALGVEPGLGRPFSREDDAPSSQQSVILSAAYWQRRYGDDPSAIGRTLIVDAVPRTIVGVMPHDFRFLNETADLIVPLRLDRGRQLLGSFNYSALARLQPGVTIAQASADLARMVPIWLNAWPSPPGFDKQAFVKSPTLYPLKREVVGNIGGVLWMLMGTIGLVLLIACANVANLLLVRAEQRQQELAVRVALGAVWHRIARALLVESLVLGLCGGALGVAVAFASVRLLVTLGPATLPRSDDIGIDSAVLSFALMASLLSSVVFGLIPILRQARASSVPVRAGERTSTHNREQHRTRHTLVVVQVSLALVLLIGSGLMIRTFLGLRAVQPGFTNPGQVQLMRITIPATLVADPERVFRMQADIRDRLAAIPGVVAASFSSAAPMEPFLSANAIFSGDRTGADGRTRRFKFVSPGFFATVGTPMVAGRDFTWAELQQRSDVAVVSNSMAREMWGSATAALGKRIRESPAAAWREIVGVAGDVFDDGVHAPAPATVYWPAVMENFEGAPLRVRRSITFVVRSPRSGSEGLVKDAQRAVWTVNGSLPLTRVRTLEAIYEQSLSRTSFTLVMLAIAAGLALLLGVVGIYGVIACAVAQRTREIGIRIALGARPRELKGTFVSQGVRLAVIGVICGSAAAAVATRLMSSLLFGISPLDPATYLGVSIVLISAAAIASYIPVHRAIAADPAKALRAQ